MILIADAGATKIQWVVIHDGKAGLPTETAGYNPYFMAPKVLTDAVEKDLVPFISPPHIKQGFLLRSRLLHHAEMRYRG